MNAHKLKSLPHDEKLRLYLHYSNLMFGFMRLSSRYMKDGDFDTSFRIARRCDKIVHKRLIRLWGVLTPEEKAEFDETLGRHVEFSQNRD